MRRKSVVHRMAIIDLSEQPCINKVMSASYFCPGGFAVRKRRLERPCATVLFVPRTSLERLALRRRCRHSHLLSHARRRVCRPTVTRVFSRLLIVPPTCSTCWTHCRSRPRSRSPLCGRVRRPTVLTRALTLGYLRRSPLRLLFVFPLSFRARLRSWFPILSRNWSPGYVTKTKFAVLTRSFCWAVPRRDIFLLWKVTLARPYVGVSADPPS